jgi:Zn-dependent protease
MDEPRFQLEHDPPPRLRPPPEPPPEKKPPRGAWASLAAGLMYVLLKLKTGLGLLKAVPLAKLAITSLSMLAMVWVEAQRYGIVFAVGFVLLIFIHEMGHGAAIRRAGLTAGWPVFIPFVGAMIALRGRPATSAVEADIAYAGPLAGTAASLACAGVHLLTGSRMWLALAYTGFFLNLFNMIPVSPLDGGRVAQAFSRRAWILGAILLGGMFFVTHTPQLLLIGVIALVQIFRGKDPSQLPATPEEQRRWMARYFGLCFFLGAAIFACGQLLGRNA